MNNIKSALLATLMIGSTTQAVEIYDGQYERDGEVSIIVKQGEISEQVSQLLTRLYPSSRVIFKQRISGYLPADIEVAGENKNVIALEVLAGLGLSACHYENNIIEIGKFKRRGICPTARMKDDKRPKVKRLGDGVLSFTNEWFGNFDPVSYGNESMAMKATYQTDGGNSPQSTSNSTRKLLSNRSDQDLKLLHDTDGEVIAEKSDVMVLEGQDNQKAIVPQSVSFKFKSGQLYPQIESLVSMLENTPKLVWELDKNIQWYNDKVIEMETYDEILAVVLDSYDAFADIYLNDVVVVRRAEGAE